MKGTRNYQILGLTPDNHVVISVDGGAPCDSGETPAQWGTWGLTRAERGILRRGLTATGRDRARPRGETMEVSS